MDLPAVKKLLAEKCSRRDRYLRRLHRLAETTAFAPGTTEGECAT
jgi:hypothetical protein